MPQEFILYSSQVLNHYAISDKFFTSDGDGKVNEKILGIELLTAEQKSQKERRAIYKDIGDTILVQLGIFPKRVSKKSISEKYYIHLGKSAYAQMESLECSFYDIPHFFHLFSTSFEYIIELLLAMKEITRFETFEQYLIECHEDTSRSSLFLTPGVVKAN